MTSVSAKGFIFANKDLCESTKERFPNFFRDEGGHRVRLRQHLDEVVEAIQPHELLDVGSANRPMLERDVNRNLTGLDIEKLTGCDELYDRFLTQSIEVPLAQSYDLIYSNAVLEHVPNNKAAAQTMYDALKPGGMVVHYLPCKNHPYALILRVVGDKLQKKIIAKLRPWTDQSITGYPTYFDHCSPGQMARLLRRTGFTNVTVIPLFRANTYFKFFFPLYVLVTAFENLCRTLNWQFFCSGMIISAEKPRQGN